MTRMWVCGGNEEGQSKELAWAEAKSKKERACRRKRRNRLQKQVGAQARKA